MVLSATLSPEGLRNLRMRLRLTQQALADQIGVHRVTLNTWENGAPIGAGALERLLQLAALNGLEVE